ncbi:alpha/beta fold hydrolase [Rubrivivax albus]|uniref:Alpha/beta hydrolase n=1 Tax=Rubrivivax albus TaxID=2499835 RepID=A0A437K1Z1_9BURK|nr:alpha/beta hydrolase [Rubrivivax albus]RVT54310.1 alpha/beta hydrolase [Rubrivivax albus]
MKLDVQGRSAYAYTGGRPFDAALPAVVFVHGALHDHSCWNLLARWAAHHGHAALAVDLPGHGFSDGPPLPDVEALASWLLALLDVAGVQQAVLVGHSMGSLIALETAGQAPGRVSRLVMMGTAYPMRVSEALLATAQAEPLKAIDMVNAWSHATHAAKPSFPGPGMWLHGSNRALMRRMQAGCTGTNLFHHEFSVCDRYRGGEAAAAKVDCPVHFVLGRSDQMTMPKAARTLAEALKAQIHEVDGGHNMMAEQPGLVLMALQQAIR